MLFMYYKLEYILTPEVFIFELVEKLVLYERCEINLLSQMSYTDDEYITSPFCNKKNCWCLDSKQITLHLSPRMLFYPVIKCLLIK